MKKILFIPTICILCVSCNANVSNPNANYNYSNGNNQMQSQPSDWEITAQVKKNLMSDNSLSSGARMISVTTNNGVVTLTGTVASRDESQRVVKMVQNVPGVSNVDNQLTISNP